MTYIANNPVRFVGESHVTASLGANHPEVGFTFTEGPRTYCWVYNDCNSQLIPGNGVILQSGATGASVTLSSTTSAAILFGTVYNATLTTGTYGFVVTKGITKVKMGATSGTVAVNGLIELAANGLFVPVSNTTGNLAPACGVALEAIVSSAVGSAFIK